MEIVFEIEDKNRKKIHLSKERWSHIRMEHPEIIEPDEIKQVLITPIKILESDRDSMVR